MSKVLRREEAPPGHRGAMTPARKRRLHEAAGGKCRDCGISLPVMGPKVIYDHLIPRELWEMADQDSNISPICRPCDKRKYPKDAADIAKARRLRTKAEGELEPGKIQSAGFRKDGPKQKIQSRPFPRRKEP